MTGISGQCVNLQIRNMLYVDICIYIYISVCVDPQSVDLQRADPPSGTPDRFPVTSFGGLEALAQPISDLDAYSFGGRLIRGSTHSGVDSFGGLEALGQPISDLDAYMPVLKKKYIGPFNVNVVSGKCTEIVGPMA